MAKKIPMGKVIIPRGDLFFPRDILSRQYIIQIKSFEASKSTRSTRRVYQKPVWQIFSGVCLNINH